MISRDGGREEILFFFFGGVGRFGIFEESGDLFSWFCFRVFVWRSCLFTVGGFSRIKRRRLFVGKSLSIGCCWRLSFVTVDLGFAGVRVVLGFS